MAVKILFLCTHNACRSQLAEAIARQRHGHRWQVASAGSEPAGRVHPLTLRHLARHGYDFRGLASKGIDIFAQEFNSSSVDFLVRWWAGSSPRDGWESKDKVIRAIKAALDDAEIEIPFPYVTHTFKETVPVSHLGDTSHPTP